MCSLSGLILSFFCVQIQGYEFFIYALLLHLSRLCLFLNLDDNSHHCPTGWSLCYCAFLQLLREISHENVVKLANVHINHADMSLYLAFDYAEHDLYVSKFLDYNFRKHACCLTHSCITLSWDRALCLNLGTSSISRPKKER